MRRCADAIMPDDLHDMRGREIGVVELNSGVARAEEVVRLKSLDQRVASPLGDVARKLVGAMMWNTLDGDCIGVGARQTRYIDDSVRGCYDERNC